MNRIQNLIEDDLESALVSTLPPVDPACDVEGAHCIFTPLHYECNYAYPLIVWLHGPDDDEHQVAQVMPLVSMRNYVGVGARGTLPSPIAEGAYRWSQGHRHIVAAEQRVLSAVAAARRWLNVAPDRMYVAGFRCGGTMAFRVALDHPDVFAGVLSINGPFPSTLRPLAQLHVARGLKIFMATGRDSLLYPQRRVCDDLRLFHAAGMSVHLRQYPCGDDVTTLMLSDMDRWIMEQLTASQPAAVTHTNYRSSGR